MILSKDLEKLEYLSENETKNENILNHWSVAQAGSNGEKTRGQKSRWTVPFKKIFLRKREPSGKDKTVHL